MIFSILSGKSAFMKFIVKFKKYIEFIYFKKYRKSVVDIRVEELEPR